MSNSSVTDIARRFGLILTPWQVTTMEYLMEHPDTRIAVQHGRRHVPPTEITESLVEHEAMRNLKPGLKTTLAESIEEDQRGMTFRALPADEAVEKPLSPHVTTNYARSIFKALVFGNPYLFAQIKVYEKSVPPNEIARRRAKAKLARRANRLRRRSF